MIGVNLYNLPQVILNIFKEKKGDGNMATVTEDFKSGLAAGLSMGAIKMVKGSTIEVDDSLSTTSENPVQNKIVTAALNTLTAKIGDIDSILDKINGEVV